MCWASSSGRGRVPSPSPPDCSKQPHWWGPAQGRGQGHPAGQSFGLGSRWRWLCSPREPGPAGRSPLGRPPVVSRAAARGGAAESVRPLRMGLSPQQQRPRAGTWGTPGAQEGQPGGQQGMAGAEPLGTRRGGPVLLPPRPAPSRPGGSGGARGSAVPSRAEPGLLQGPAGAGSWAGPCLGTAAPSASALALRAGREGPAWIRLPAGSILTAAAPVALGCSQQPSQTRGEGRELVWACPWRVMGQQVERS